ncbi:MAG: hypothetical protein IJS90_10255 [Clostridia bacterium]|nr:hypothetical protein [Clostridia bacterium]
MDVKTGMIIIGEAVFTAAVIYLFFKEDRLTALENGMIKKMKAALEARRLIRRIKKQNKINKKALYTPVRAGTREKEGIKAA